MRVRVRLSCHAQLVHISSHIYLAAARFCGLASARDRWSRAAAHWRARPMLRFSLSALKGRKTRHDTIITCVTVTHVRRESSGALSFRAAVVPRVKISNIRFEKEREALHNCGHRCCLRLCGRLEVDSAERGVGNYRVITFDILLTIPLSVPAFKGTNSKMFRSLARGVRHNNNISCQP